jgi:hypothetical protein
LKFQQRFGRGLYGELRSVDFDGLFGIQISQPATMRWSFFLWSGIVQSLVAVEAFAALSHQSFATRPATATSLLSGKPPSSSGSALLTTSTALEVSAGGGGASATPEGGTATIPNEVFNLVKSIVGAGVLSVSKKQSRWPLIPVVRGTEILPAGKQPSHH